MQRCPGRANLGVAALDEESPPAKTDNWSPVPDGQEALFRRVSQGCLVWGSEPFVLSGSVHKMTDAPCILRRRNAVHPGPEHCFEQGSIPVSHQGGPAGHTRPKTVHKDACN